MISGEYGGAFRYFRNTGSGSPAFVEQIGAQNPANGLATASVHSQPALVDLDGDGDLDLVAGSFGGTFQYFHNVGTPLAPAFAAAPTNPLAGFDVGNSSAPTFGDLDRDGDADLVAGRITGTFAYYQNTGSATLPAFVERVGTLNPLDSANIATNLASPALGDADGDGDLDLVSGRDQGNFSYFENTGSARRASFIVRPDAANPLRGENVGSAFAKAAFADLDRDGDLDVVGGSDAGTFLVLDNQIGRLVVSGEIDPDSVSPGSPFVTPAADFDGDGDIGVFVAGVVFDPNPPGPCTYYDNIGTASNPQFTASTLPGLSTTSCISLPTPVDLDGDSDMDLFSRGFLYVNTGTPSSPSFGPALTYFSPVPGFQLASASFADVDGDGDLDAAVLYQDVSVGFAKYYENTGGSTTPAFIERTGSANPLAAIPNLVALMDPDKDGDVDVLSVPRLSDTLQSAGGYWENVGSSTAPEFVNRPITSAKSPFAHAATFDVADVARGFTAPLADLDGDGDIDGFGWILREPIPPITFDGVLLENGIVRPSPRHYGPIARPFATQNAGFIAAPAAGDLDADGDPDFLLAGSFGSGAIRYFENTGTALLSSVTERTGGANPFDGLNAGTTPMLALGDLDADGDFDLLVGTYTGVPWKYFRNTGTRTAPAFVELLVGTNPLDLQIPRGAPALGDLDADGDLDIVAGTAGGAFRYILNAGNAVQFDQAEQTGAFNPFDGLSVPTTFLAHPTLGDVDRDGDLDLVAGDEPSGQFYYFENTGTATTPSFVARSGPDNPLNGKDVGQSSTPVLIDLDADDDLDVVSGELGGELRQYYLPEPSLRSLFVSGLGLLSWLARRRI